MKYNNYYVGDLYLYYPDLKGNSTPKYYDKRILKKRIDGTYNDINTNEKFYSIPKAEYIRGIYVDKHSLIKLSDYLIIHNIQDENFDKIRNLTIL